MFISPLAATVAAIVVPISSLVPKIQDISFELHLEMLLLSSGWCRLTTPLLTRFRLTECGPSGSLSAGHCLQRRLRLLGARFRLLCSRHRLLGVRLRRGDPSHRLGLAPLCVALGGPRRCRTALQRGNPIRHLLPCASKLGERGIPGCHCVCFASGRLRFCFLSDMLCGDGSGHPRCRVLEPSRRRFAFRERRVCACLSACRASRDAGSNGLAAPPTYHEEQ
mmetsp:Transcript_22528/g.62695  ORF Transcript_22528/g.62695 Transcript_22528/m.62695 type:complete len:222 (-) Transcript_22528:2823-3488(-)